MHLIDRRELTKDSLKDFYKTLDVFKFIFAFFVIAIHVHFVDSFENYYLKEFFGQLFNVAVPFFFMASGFLVEAKVDHSSEEYRMVFKRHLFKIAKMYIVWNIIYAPLAVYGLMKKGISPLAMLKRYIQYFIFVGEHYNSWHLWYLLSTVYTFALLFLLAGKIEKNFSKVLLSVIFVAAIISTIVHWIISTTMLGDDSIAKELISSTVVGGRVINGLIYIPIGMLLYRYTFCNGIKIIAFIGCYILDVIIKNDAISSIFAAIYFVLLFEILMEVKTGVDKTVFLRSMSTNIYLIHMYVWTSIYILLYHKQVYGIQIFVVTSVISLAVSWLWDIIKARIATKKEKNSN